MSEEPITKKRHLDQKENEIDDTTKFGGFNVIKVLLNDPQSKRIHVHGKFKDSDEDTIVTLVKTPFSDDNVKNVISSQSSFKNEFKNNVYSQYTVFSEPCDNVITGQVIHPATEKHIMKYSKQIIYVVEESLEDYQNITLPHLQEQQLKIDWVYNILEHKAESERILYEDNDPINGFVMMPDFKWDGKIITNMYVLAICHQHGIKSLRDLNETHLPLLKNIQKNGLRVIEEKYGFSKKEVRCYLHYYPSYYHLHVHFNPIEYEIGGTHVGKAHLLSDVIDNIENIDPLYYQKKTLSVLIREKDPLLQKLLKT